jgi:cysteine synthase B
MTIILNKKSTKDLKHKLWILEAEIGNTPLLPINKLYENKAVKIYAKAEWEQLSASVKARAAFYIIKDALLRGEFDNDKILLDATSGNTGIAYATIGAILGIPVTLCLPENASAERVSILKSLGAEIVFTSKFGGTDEAQETAAELANSFPHLYYYANQYKNNENWKAHYNTTAVEIFEALPNITHFVTGLGTTGSFTGTGKRLKEYNGDIKLVALQPDFAMHGLEGWKHLETALVPEIYDARLADSVIEISSAEAYRVIAEAANKEGLRLSPSSAANLAGAIAVAKQLEHGNIVTLLPDNADKYSEIINKIL